MLDPIVGDDVGAGRFSLIRVERPEDVPPPDDGAIDIALLDMNHGFANVGHDAIAALVRDAASEFAPELDAANRRVRLLSYAVRDRLMVPRHEEGRHRLYLGTGGPGHLDPRRNVSADGTRAIVEDPAWEAPLWRLFDAIAADPDAALYGVCHTFGLMCRWSGAAEPVLRGPEIGGAMSGVGTNVLTPAALAHPWFARLAETLPSHELVPVLDSRYYDLVPTGALDERATPIAFESSRADAREPGRALTMIELARSGDGALPRVFGVNSHPEIGSAERVRALLEDMLARGTIDRTVYDDRTRMLPMLRDDRREERLTVARFVFGDLVRRSVERLAAAA